MNDGEPNHDAAPKCRSGARRPTGALAFVACLAALIASVFIAIGWLVGDSKDDGIGRDVTADDVDTAAQRTGGTPEGADVANTARSTLGDPQTGDREGIVSAEGTGTLAIKLIDQVNGAPIQESVVVRLYLVEEREVRRTRGVCQLVDGLATFDGLAYGNYSCNLEIASTNSALCSFSVPADSAMLGTEAWIMPLIDFDAESTNCTVVAPHYANVIIYPDMVRAPTWECTVESVDSRTPTRDVVAAAFDGSVYRAARVEPGMYRVELRPPLGSDGDSHAWRSLNATFRPAPVDVIVESQSDTVVHFDRSAQEWRIEGAVRWSDGRAAEDVEVVLFYTGSAVAASAHVRPLTMRNVAARVWTNGNGRFEFNGVRPSQLVLSPLPDGAIDTRSGWPVLAQNPPQVAIRFDSSAAANTVNVGALTLVASRRVTVSGALTLGVEGSAADLRCRVHTRDPQDLTPGQISPGWIVDVDERGRFQVAVEGNTALGAVWIEVWRAGAPDVRRKIVVTLDERDEVDLGVVHI